MSAAALLTRLCLATLALTLLAGGLVLARRALRERLGAEAAYALWLLVPLGVGLCCWPVHRELVPAAAAAAPVLQVGLLQPLPAAPSTGLDAAAVLACIWLLGVAGSVLWLCLQQRAFTRALGALQPLGEDTWISTRSDAGPLLAGLLRPRIVLPADYATRYSPQEQAAVLAHERMHRRRGDLWWNLLCAAVRSAFWFHPLASIAQRSYLADQELACDSAVLGSGAHAPHTYANALLKTQLGMTLPLGCAMQALSPLRERILNLGRRAAPRRLRMLTALVLSGVAVAGGQIAWAASAEKVAAAGLHAHTPAARYDVNMTIGIRGEQSAPRLLVKQGEPFAVAGEHGGTPWRVEFTLERTQDRMVRLTGRILDDGKTIAAPVLVGPPGEAVRVKVGDDVQVALTVREHAG